MIRWVLITFLLLGQTSMLGSRYLTIGEQPFRILSVTTERPYVSYDGSVAVEVTLIHENSIPVSATLYYIGLLNGTEPQGGWRISLARLAISNGRLSIFQAEVPSRSYKETFSHNTKIVFYVEARDSEGNVALSVEPTRRWDPYDAAKHAVWVIDYYGPSIDVSHYPESPTSDERIVIRAFLQDRSGIKEVMLSYFVENVGLSKNVTMVPIISTPREAVYEAALPPLASGSSVRYFVFAYDHVGNRNVSPERRFTVGLGFNELRIRTLIGSIVAIALTAAAILIFIRLMRSEAYKLGQRAAGRPLSLTLLASLGQVVIASLSYGLALSGSAHLGILIMFATLTLWVFADPRLELIPLKCRLDFFAERPPAILAAYAVVVFVMGWGASAFHYLAGWYSAASAYRDAVTVGTYSLILFGLAVTAQIFWPTIRQLRVGVTFAGQGKS